MVQESNKIMEAKEGWEENDLHNDLRNIHKGELYILCQFIMEEIWLLNMIWEDRFCEFRMIVIRNEIKIGSFYYIRITMLRRKI